MWTTKSKQCDCVAKFKSSKGPDTRCNIACNIACNGVDTRCNCCVKCCRSRTCFYSCNIARNIARNVASCVRSLSPLQGDLRQAWECAERIRETADVWCQTKSPGYWAVFAKAKTEVNAARRRIIFLLCSIFTYFKLSREKGCFAISTQMPASTVYTRAKTTNYTRAKLWKITCELFSRLEKDLAAVWTQVKNFFKWE